MFQDWATLKIYSKRLGLCAKTQPFELSMKSSAYPAALEENMVERLAGLGIHSYLDYFVFSGCPHLSNSSNRIDARLCNFALAAKTNNSNSVALL